MAQSTEKSHNNHWAPHPAGLPRTTPLTPTFKTTYIGVFSARKLGKKKQGREETGADLLLVSTRSCPFAPRRSSQQHPGVQQ